MEEENREQYAGNGKRIIASISLGEERYYIDENRDVYEKLGNVFVEVTNEEIIQKVKAVLSMPSKDEFMY